MIRSELRSKRPRESMNGASQEKRRADRVVNQLYQAVTSEQRLIATRRLLQELQKRNSHDDTRSCMLYSDNLLQAGVVNALCVYLGFVINTGQYPESCNRDPTDRIANTDEIDTIGYILNTIYRSCTESAREESLLSHGNELFHLLTKGLSFVSPSPILATFHACSGSSHGTALLLRNGAIGSITRVIQEKKINDDNTLLEALGILKNLSYYGEESRLEIAEHDVLKQQLADIPFSYLRACTTRKNSEKDKVLERLSAIFRNLAVSPSPRRLLAGFPPLLNAIIRMGSHPSRQIHRNILNFLLSVGQDVDSCIILCLHGDGMLVNLLKRFMSNDEDAAIRKRAVRILRMLACEGSATLLIHDAKLLSCLLEQALHDVSHDVRTEATDAIARLAVFIAAPMTGHQQMLDALTQLASSPTTQPEVLALALMKQASHPTNRSSIAERSVLLASLARIAVSTDTTNQAKDYACCALLELTKEESSRDRLATGTILEALTLNSIAGHRRDHPSHHNNFGIQALVNLAKRKTNRKAMAHHHLLLQTLVQYAASSRVHEVKANVKKTILMLVSEL